MHTTISQHQTWAATIVCGLHTSDYRRQIWRSIIIVAFTYPSANFRCGKPTSSVACTHRFAEVKRVLAILPVASTPQTTNIRSSYPHC